MKIEEVLTKVDHTLLRVGAKEAEFAELCDDGVGYNVASVCVPPSRVSFCAHRLYRSHVGVTAVVGFPHGNTITDVKAYEARKCINDGASEIDAVINIGYIKDKLWDAVEGEMEELRFATRDVILKVIIETGILAFDEKIRVCRAVRECGADYIKTSTGYNGRGATFDDVSLLAANAADGKRQMKVKASGGINTLEDAARFLEIGAQRLGTSKIVMIAKGISSC